MLLTLLLKLLMSPKQLPHKKKNRTAVTHEFSFSLEDCTSKVNEKISHIFIGQMIVFTLVKMPFISHQGLKSSLINTLYEAIIFQTIFDKYLQTAQRYNCSTTHVCVHASRQPDKHPQALAPKWYSTLYRCSGRAYQVRWND